MAGTSFQSARSNLSFHARPIHSCAVSFYSLNATRENFLWNSIYKCVHEWPVSQPASSISQRPLVTQLLSGPQSSTAAESFDDCLSKITRTVDVEKRIEKRIDVAEPEGDA